ncbi:MAG: amino acid permease, partial [Blastochloris sp.]|nr:amino acid permease [Blastochloris sp.]
MLRNSPASSASPNRPAIRFSRTVGLPRAVAKGCTISIVLGIFVLGDLFLQAGDAKTPQAYLAAMLLALPFILSYAERGAVISGSGGVYGLVRASGSTWRTYMSGWLLLGGHLVLIALFGWGAALYLQTALISLVQLSVDTHWLAAGIVSLVALNDVVGLQRGWRLRVFLVYASIGVLLLLLGYLWLIPTVPGAYQPLPLLAPAGDTSSMVRLVAMLSAMLWSIHFIIDSREDMQRPAAIMLPALLLPLLLSGLLGMLIAATVLRANLEPGALLPLAEMLRLADTTSSPLLQIIYLGTGFLISLVALSRTMVVLIRLTGTMVSDGFLPSRFWELSLGVPLFALGVFAL